MSHTWVQILPRSWLFKLPLVAVRVDNEKLWNSCFYFVRGQSIPTVPSLVLDSPWDYSGNAQLSVCLQVLVANSGKSGKGSSSCQHLSYQSQGARYKLTGIIGNVIVCSPFQNRQLCVCVDLK